MDFKKRFDYNNIDNFLPDNITIGRSNYFESKFKHKLPLGYACILEAKSRIEYTEMDEKEVINDVLQKERDFVKQLLNEYEERQLEGLNEKIDEMNITFVAKEQTNIKLISDDNNINE